MRKILFLLLLVAATLSLFGCMDNGETDPSNPDQKEEERVPGDKKVRFFIDGQYVIEKYNIGEIPTPPAVSDIEKEHYSLRFVGWDREMSAVTGDESVDVYRAVFESTPRNYTVTLVIDGEEQKHTVAYGKEIPFPAADTIPVPTGAQFAGWSTKNSLCSGDMTVYPIYTYLYDKATMSSIYFHGLSSYAPNDTENNENILAEVSAFLALATEEHEHPMDGAIKERVLAHLRNICKGGVEPGFDSGPHWSYSVLTAAIAVAKDTPTVWNALTMDEVARLDCIMRSFAVIGCFATDSDNNFLTGPSLNGNYNKSWNPNYRLAMVPTLLFCKSYFGSTAAVNQIFADFNYSDYIDDFKKFGFTRALEVWTTEEHSVYVGNKTPLYDANHKKTTYSGDLIVPGVRELFMATSKIKAYAYDTRYDGDLVEAGSGIGVRGNTYTYTYSWVSGGTTVKKSYSLDDIAGIVFALLDYTYSGGAVKNSWTDGKNNAYIIDGTDSIMLGKTGMIKEFNTGNRSSAGYSSHDFVLAVEMIYALEVLGMYDIHDTAGMAPALATQKKDLWSRVCVGNEDLIYKLIHGYMSWAESSGETSRTDEANRGFEYTVAKSIWCRYFYPDSYGKTTMPEGCG